MVDLSGKSASGCRTMYDFWMAMYRRADPCDHEGGRNGVLRQCRDSFNIVRRKPAAQMTEKELEAEAQKPNFWTKRMEHNLRIARPTDKMSACERAFQMTLADVFLASKAHKRMKGEGQRPKPLQR